MYTEPFPEDVANPPILPLSWRRSMVDTCTVLFIRRLLQSITVFESVSMGSKLSGLGQASTSRTNFASPAAFADTLLGPSSDVDGITYKR
jgi:hypothetical protein